MYKNASNIDRNNNKATIHYTLLQIFHWEMQLIYLWMNVCIPCSLWFCGWKILQRRLIMDLKLQVPFINTVPKAENNLFLSPSFCSSREKNLCHSAILRNKAWTWGDIIRRVTFPQKNDLWCSFANLTQKYEFNTVPYYDPAMTSWNDVR